MHYSFIFPNKTAVLAGGKKQTFLREVIGKWSDWIVGAQSSGFKCILPGPMYIFYTYCSCLCLKLNMAQIVIKTWKQIKYTISEYFAGMFWMNIS